MRRWGAVRAPPAAASIKFLTKLNPVKPPGTRLVRPVVWEWQHCEPPPYPDRRRNDRPALTSSYLPAPDSHRGRLDGSIARRWAMLPARLFGAETLRLRKNLDPVRFEHGLARSPEDIRFYTSQSGSLVSGATCISAAVGCNLSQHPVRRRITQPVGPSSVDRVEEAKRVRM
jgi:hypothetical protein